MMHALDWLRDGGRAEARPVYAIFGGDSYLVRESVDTIAASLFPQADGEPAITRFPGSQTRLADVLDELFTLPFFSKRRLVVVDDADGFITKHRKDLEAYVQSPSRTGVLVLQARTWTSSTNLAKLVEQHGQAIDCGALGEKQTGKLATWLVHRSRTRCRAELDRDAANLLIELAGLDVGILASEVEKLAVYVGESRRIEQDDVARMVGAGRVDTIWKALDAATSGHKKLALELLDNLLAAGEIPIVLLAAISASLLKVYHAGRLRSARLPLDEACRIAGIPSFFVEKTGRQHAHLGPRRVDHLPATLLRADLDLKGGSSLNPRVVLELLMVKLSLPRTD